MQDDAARSRRRCRTRPLLLLLLLLVALALASAVDAQQESQRQVPSAQGGVRIPLARVDRDRDRRRLQQLTHGDDSSSNRATLSSEHLRDVHLALQQQRVRRRLGEAADHANDGTNATVSRAKTMVFSEVPLGVGFGTHYAELYLGVPAQRASVIVDTGSHLTALPCSSCKGCGDHTDPFFDITKSTTAKFATCREFAACNTCTDDRCYISQSYTEGSMWRAVVVDELVWVGGFGGTDADFIMHHYGVRFPLGCQTQETGLFISQKENGIMGMGRHRATVLSHMVRAKRVEHDVFSLCFGARGGGLVLGGVDPTHHTSAIAYTPLIADSSGWYPVRVKDIAVGGASLGIAPSALNSGKGVIVDSGTTDTFFVASGARAFLNAFAKASGGIAYSESKMSIRSEDLARLPNITITLDGMVQGQSNSSSSDRPVQDIELTLTPHKYLTLSDDGTYYYGNVHFSERSGGVLGASTMVGYDVVFDTENKRVGFADANCDAMSTASPVAASPGASNATSAGNTTSATQTNANPLDSLNYSSFFAQILVVSLIGLVVLVAVVYRRLHQRAWYAIPGDSTLGTPKEEDFSTDHDDTDHDDGEDDAHRAPDSATSTTAVVRSPPRRQRVVSPKFTIGSDDEDDLDGNTVGDGSRTTMVLEHSDDALEAHSAAQDDDDDESPPEAGAAV